MRISPGIVLRPTPPPVFRTQGHSPPPSDLRGGRGAKDGNPTLQESGFPASLRSGVPARTAGLRGEIKEEAFAEGGCRGTFAPKACRPRRDPSGRREARNQAPGSLDEHRRHHPCPRRRNPYNPPPPRLPVAPAGAFAMPDVAAEAPPLPTFALLSPPPPPPTPLLSHPSLLFYSFSFLFFFL